MSRSGPPSFHPERMQPERRHRGHGCRVGRGREVDRPRGGLTEREGQAAVGAARLEAGHLLLEHAGDQHLDRVPGACEPDPSQAPVQVGDHAMVRPEVAVVVEQAGPSGRVVERAGGAGTPRFREQPIALDA